MESPVRTQAVSAPSPCVALPSPGFERALAGCGGREADERPWFGLPSKGSSVPRKRGPKEGATPTPPQTLQPHGHAPPAPPAAPQPPQPHARASTTRTTAACRAIASRDERRSAHFCPFPLSPRLSVGLPRGTSRVTVSGAAGTEWLGCMRVLASGLRPHGNELGCQTKLGCVFHSDFTSTPPHHHHHPTPFHKIINTEINKESPENTELSLRTAFASALPGRTPPLHCHFFRPTKTGFGIDLPPPQIKKNASE